MLNNTQLVTLRTAIDADPVLVQAISAGSVNVVVKAFNAPASPDFTVWKTSVRTEEVFDAINWATLTPADIPDGTAAYTNRSLACQGKQFNLQTILTGRDSISGSKLNIRAGLQDALTNVPSGTGGNPVNAGWAGVKAVLSRLATRGEQLFAIGTGSVASPATLVLDGNITDSDVEQAMRL